jgi:hypothetical protein
MAKYNKYSKYDLVSDSKLELERSIEHKTRTMARMGRHPKIMAAHQWNNQVVGPSGS